MRLYDEWVKLQDEGMSSERAIRLLAARNAMTPEDVWAIVFKTLRS